MKKSNKILIIAFALTLVLGIFPQVYADNKVSSNFSRLNEYSKDMIQINDELISQKIEEIPLTVTLRNIVEIDELEELSYNSNLNMVMVQARGYDSNGDRITFISKTHKGLKETDDILKSMAEENNVKFVGYNSFFAVADYEMLSELQKDDKVFLVDTSSYNLEERSYKTNSKGVCFPHPVYWELEEINGLNE